MDLSTPKKTLYILLPTRNLIESPLWPNSRSARFTIQDCYSASGFELKNTTTGPEKDN